jgi:outer membrane protein
MKKTTSAIFTLIAVVTMLLAISCNSSSTDTNSTATSQYGGEIITPTEGSTVFVRMDSLLNQYDMFLDLGAELEEKVKRAQSDLDTKGRAFERDVIDFQDKVNKGLLTRSESQRLADELSRREQQLREQQQKTSMELEDENRVMLNRVSQSIDDYIKTYNQEKMYSLIINTSGNSTVLWGNPGLDITTDLVKGLNDSYATSLKSPQQPAADTTK